MTEGWERERYIDSDRGMGEREVLMLDRESNRGMGEREY